MLDRAFTAGRSRRVGTLNTILRSGRRGSLYSFSTDRNCRASLLLSRQPEHFPVVVTAFNVQFSQKADRSIEPVSFSVLMVF